MSIETIESPMLDLTQTESQPQPDAAALALLSDQQQLVRERFKDGTYNAADLRVLERALDELAAALLREQRLREERDALHWQRRALDTTVADLRARIDTLKAEVERLRSSLARAHCASLKSFMDEINDGVYALEHFDPDLLDGLRKVIR